MEETQSPSAPKKRGRRPGQKNRKPTAPSSLAAGAANQIELASGGTGAATPGTVTPSRTTRRRARTKTRTTMASGTTGGTNLITPGLSRLYYDLGLLTAKIEAHGQTIAQITGNMRASSS